MKMKIGIGILVLSLIMIITGVVLSTRVVEYTVKFTGITPVKSEKVKSGSYVKRPDDPVKEGSTFIGWYHNDKLFDFNSKVSSDITLVAKWTAGIDDGDGFKVTFDTDGGSFVDPVIVKKGGILTEPTGFTKKGYSLKEWQLNGKKYDFNSPVVSDITLKAIWEKDDDTEDKFLVTFDSDGGTKINSQTVVKEGKVEIPTTPTKKGYTFVQWQLNGKKYDFSANVVSDITLKAVWKSNTKSFNITFNSGGGTKVNSQTVEEGKLVTKPANPTKTGYVFEAWQLNGKNYDFNTKVSSDITLVAKYRALKTISIAFDTGDGGSKVPTQTIVEGNKINVPAVPTKEGYKFVEWQLNGKKFDFNTKITSDITLKALWQEQE